MQDFEQAWDKIILGAERTTVLTPHDRRVVAYHEGGHAVVAWMTPAADPVRKVTIVPHGQALGVTQQRPAEERYNYSRTDLLARIDVMLGGRASEERTCPVAVGLRPRSRNLLARHFELVLRAKPILAIEAVHAAALEVELIGALGDVGGRQDDERG